MKPIVALVGRPNVGKSTLFNRITRTKDALVDDFPGVTRDRHYGDASWDDVPFTLIDTGGFTDYDDFSDAIRYQIRQAIDEADIVVHLMDGKTGLSPFDRDMVAILRSSDKPVFYVVNKIDGSEQEDRLYEFYSLGLDLLHPLSAEHRYGFIDFMDELVRTVADVIKSAAVEDEQDLIRIAVVGRPNVGKSSLINRILGQERLVVSDRPGTTRDAIDTVCQINGKSYLLVDTAGIRRKGKVRAKLEKFSIIKSLKSLDRCDIALVLFDADEGITDQDVTIAGYAHERGCGCVLLLNKWDLVDRADDAYKKHIDRLRYEAKFLSFAPAITVSALTGLRVHRIFKQVDKVYEQYSTRIGTGRLNQIITSATERTEPSLHRGRRIKFYYSTQIKTKPPTFLSFVNYPDAVHFSYRRYLLNSIRQETGLDMTPLRLRFRKREGNRKGRKG